MYFDHIHCPQLLSYTSALPLSPYPPSLSFMSSPHWVLFVLSNCSRKLCLPWSGPPSWRVTSLKENDSPISISYQISRATQLVVGSHGKLTNSMLGFCPVWAFRSLLHAVMIALIPYVLLPCCAWFPWRELLLFQEEASKKNSRKKRCLGQGR